MNTANSLKDLGKLAGAGNEKPNKPTKSKKSSNNQQAKKKTQTTAANNGFTLSTQATVNCFQAIATLNKVEKRSDLQHLLCAPKQNLPPRLKAYFEKIGVFDDQQNLTQAGQKLKVQGEITLPEQGLYNLWYCEHPLLGNQLIAVQRLNAHKTQVVTKALAKKGQASIGIFRTQSPQCAVFNYQKLKWDHCQIAVSDIDIVSMPVTTDGKLIWNIDNNNQINLSTTLKIRLPSGDHSQKQAKELELPVAFNGNAIKSADLAYDALANAFNGKWNSKSKTIQLPFSNSINNWQSINSCELRNIPKELKLHSVGMLAVDSFNKVAIEPLAETAEGKKWLEAWLKHYFAQQPVSPLQAEKDQLAWRSKPQLAHHDIVPMGQHEILQLLEEEGRNKAFWNATATMDLVPAQPQSVGLPLTLQEGDNLTPAALLSELTGKKQVNKLLISDRYYRTRDQQKLLHELAEESLSGGILVSSKETDRQDLPKSFDLIQFERNMPENHDRYWVLFTNSGPMVWKVSTSMDFLKPSAVTNSWQVHGYPTFTPMKTTDLPQFLKPAVEASQ